MRALVVFESMFGNTKLIAEAVAAGLAERMETELVDVGAAPAAIAGDVDLLVVGGPTHVMGMSRPNTRRDAAHQVAVGTGATAERPVVSTDVGIREWLTTVDLGLLAPAVAVFDTRMRSPFAGSAAAKASRLLRGRGVHVVGRRHFYVTGTRGPLRDAERAEARWWAEDLAARHIANGVMVAGPAGPAGRDGARG